MVLEQSKIGLNFFRGVKRKGKGRGKGRGGTKREEGEEGSQQRSY